MFKTVTLTWNDKRLDAPFPNAVKVALWCGNGDDSEVNAALAYAAAETRRTGNTYRVHTFATDETQWRNKSAAAHAAGHGV